MVSITYIWHDCFVFSDDRISIVFDYWKDPLTDNGELPRFLEGLDRDKPLYVVVSHHHKDHFNRDIFEWSDRFPNIRYILSNDVAKFVRHIITPGGTYAGIRPTPESVTVLRRGESFSDDFIHVDAFGSTDIGNSYAVTAGDFKIFHAGDLNAWIWLDESTQAEVNKAMGDFKAVLKDISLKFDGFDMAMFPVDSRIGREYYTGASIFVREFDVKHFFPMHFGLGDTAEEQLRYQLDAAKIRDYANPDRGEYICLQSPYSTFAL